MSDVGRPKKENKKTTMSITIDKELNEKLETYLIENNLSKSEYITYLINKDNKKNDNNE